MRAATVGITPDEAAEDLLLLLLDEGPERRLDGAKSSSVNDVLRRDDLRDMIVVY